MKVLKNHKQPRQMKLYPLFHNPENRVYISGNNPGKEYLSEFSNMGYLQLCQKRND